MPEDTKNGGLEPANTSLPDSYKLPQTQSNNVRSLENSFSTAFRREARTSRAHDTTTPDEMHAGVALSRFFARIPTILLTVFYTVVADEATFSAMVGESEVG